MPSRPINRRTLLDRRLRKLRMEELEDRRMLATITVNSLADNMIVDGQVTLREAIEAANTNASVDGSVAGDVSADTIEFAASLAGDTITLDGDDIDITEALTIDATSSGGVVTIDADQQSRIFDITAVSGNFTFRKLTLTGGKTTGISQSGGAIRSFSSGQLSVDQSTISGNNTTGQSSKGGGINTNGAVTLTNSTVSGNSTTGNQAYGGGIWAGDVILTNSTVSGNSTTGNNANGGGIFANGDFTLTNSTISGNRSTGSMANGAGITNTNTGNTVTINHSTITDNRATYANATAGGILVNISTTTVITNSIIAGNTAGGGSPDFFQGVGGSITLSHSLIGDNAGTPFAEAPVGSPDLQGNLVGGAVNGVIDPLLGPLTNNGGPTLTHALLAGSPAIDAGAMTSTEQHDQRGAPFVRIENGFADIGAYERQTLPASLFVVTTTADELDYSNADVSLREAITSANGSVGADTISFSSLFDAPQTIDLSNQLPTIREELTIDGPGATLLTIDAGGGTDNTVGTGDGFRIFEIDDDSPTTTIPVTLRGLTLTGGDVTGNGGAILSAENLTLENSTITGNAASDYGGGLDVSKLDTTTKIHASTVSYNSAVHGGGLYVRDYSTISNSTIDNNSATGSGGGIVDLGTTIITNSTISGNSADGLGGGIFIDTFHGTTKTISSSTISGNLANSSGAGIYIGAYGVSTVILNNSIITGEIVNHRIVNGSYNLLQSGVTNLADSTNNLINSLYGDPDLGPLANNGGPTLTHALQPNSPAIDAGDPGFNPGVFTPPLDFDQRGAPFARKVGPRIDIGAYEVPPPPNEAPQIDSFFVPDVTQADDGATLYQFTVTYTDDSAIDFTSIDAGDLIIGGPSEAPFVFDAELDLFSNGSPRTVTYSAEPPGGSWDASDAGLYEINLIIDQVFDDGAPPLAVPAQTLATFSVNIVPPENQTPQVDSVLAPDVDENSILGSYLVDVTYTDDSAIDFTSIDDGDLVIDRVGGGAAPMIVSGFADDGVNGSPRTGIYEFTPPGGSWDFADNGTYQVSLVAGQVLDDGVPPLAVPGGALGTFNVSIPAPSLNANFDGDNDVDGADFLIWQRNFMTGTTHPQGDADYNGTVDGTDLGIWQTQYGQPPVTLVAAVAHEQPAGGIGQEEGEPATEVATPAPAQLAALAGWQAMTSPKPMTELATFESNIQLIEREQAFAELVPSAPAERAGFEEAYAVLNRITEESTTDADENQFDKLIAELDDEFLVGI